MSAGFAVESAPRRLLAPCDDQHQIDAAPSGQRKLNKSARRRLTSRMAELAVPARMAPTCSYVRLSGWSFGAPEDILATPRHPSHRGISELGFGRRASQQFLIGDEGRPPKLWRRVAITYVRPPRTSRGAPTGPRAAA